MATVLIMESNRAGSGTMALHHARQLGFRAHFMCRSPDEYESLPVSPLTVADEVTVVDTFDIGRLIHAVDGRADYAAVLAYDDPCVLQASMLGQYLGLAHNPPPSGVARARFKDRLRATLASTAWNVRHAVIPLTAKHSPIGYPCVVKPTDVAGNYGVTVCRDARDFQQALELLRSFFERPYAHGYRPHPVALVEEFLPGTEFSAEMVWGARTQEWRLVGFTTKELGSDDCPIEVEHIFPHGFEPDIAESVLAQLRGCLHAIGIRDTLVHVEFRLSGDRLSLIEVNCRPAGGHINDLVETALGSSLIHLHLAAHLGEADAALDRTRLRRHAGIRFLLPRRAGVIERFTIEPSADPAVLDLQTAATPVQADATLTSDSRLGHVLVQADREEQVARLLARHIGRIHACYGAAPTARRPDADQVRTETG